MKLSEQKAQLVKRILETDNMEVLGYIEAILDNDVDRWEEEMPTYIIESIEQGLADVDAGRVTPHAEVMKKYKKWLTK